MRQAGILAAAAGYALDHQLGRLADDHLAARAFAEALAEQASWAIDVRTSPQTNIVVFDTGSRAAAEVVSAAGDAGVLLSAVGPRTARAVTHLDVTVDQCAAAGRIAGGLLAR